MSITTRTPSRRGSSSAAKIREQQKMSKVCLGCHADSSCRKCQMSPKTHTQSENGSQIPLLLFQVEHTPSYPPIKGLKEQNGEGDQGEGHQLPQGQRPDPSHPGWGHWRGGFWPLSSDARRCGISLGSVIYARLSYLLIYREMD